MGEEPGFPQVVARESRVLNNAGSWHNPTGLCVRQLDTDIWVIERGYIDHGMDVGAKATIIRLPNSRLLIHSCLPLDRATKTQVDALGTVSVVVGGNAQHVDFIAWWKQHYPSATCLGPPGLVSSRKDVPFDDELRTDGVAHESYAEGGVVQQVFVGGCDVMRETAFFHVPSGTLVTTDLVFPFPRNVPFGTWVAGLGLRYVFLPVLKRWFVQDRRVFDEAIRRADEWECRRIVPCHGEVVESGARELFKEWHGLA